MFYIKTPKTVTAVITRTPTATLHRVTDFIHYDIPFRCRHSWTCARSAVFRNLDPFQRSEGRGPQAARSHEARRHVRGIWTIGRSSKIREWMRVALSGFEPESPAPKASMINHYTTGLLKPLRQFPYKIFPCRYVAAQSVRRVYSNFEALNSRILRDIVVVSGVSGGWKPPEGPGTNEKS